MQEHLKCWPWRLTSLLRAEHKFNWGITGLKKAEKMVMTMLPMLSRPSRSTVDENIEAVKKIILGNSRIIIREVPDDVGISFGSCQAIFTNVWGI